MDSDCDAELIARELCRLLLEDDPKAVCIFADGGEGITLIDGRFRLLPITRRLLLTIDRMRQQT